MQGIELCMLFLLLMYIIVIVVILVFAYLWPRMYFSLYNLTVGYGRFKSVEACSFR